MILNQTMLIHRHVKNLGLKVVHISDLEVKNTAFEKIYSLKKEAAKTLFGLISSVEKESRLTTRFIALVTSTIVLYSLKSFKGL